MKITEIINMRPNAYQGMTGVDFKVEGNPNKISALTKNTDQFVVGNDLPGEITTKEKDGRTFYNWQFPKGGGRSTSSSGMSPEQFQRLSDKIDAANTNALRAVGLIQELARALRDSDVISANQVGDGYDSQRDIADGAAW